MDCCTFDEQVVRRDPRGRTDGPVLVCVRLVQANALDLTLFQFDYDLSFAVFFLNADRTVYGRFGSRSDRAEAIRDMSIEDSAPPWRGSGAALASTRPTGRAGRKATPADILSHPDAYPSLRGNTLPPRLRGKVAELHPLSPGAGGRTPHSCVTPGNRFPTTSFIPGPCRKPSDCSIRRRL
jgi:hypothetical protein